MKLIIDIPEEKYTAIKNNLGTFPREYKEWGLQAIADGTPLDDIKTLKHRSYLEGFHEAYQMYYKMFDDIKAEIEEHIKYNKKMNYMGVVSGLLISRDIINDYTGKEQSE